MDWLYDIDWGTLLLPSAPLLEIVIRGTVVYLALFTLLRFILKRQPGTFAPSDVLVVVLIADAAQNAMASNYRSLPDGILLVTVIIFWSWAVDWLGYRVPAFQRLVYPPALLLVKNGRIQWHNMDKELVTREELVGKLRERGVTSLSQVREARMEGDGTITVIPHQGAIGRQEEGPRRRV